MLEKLGLWIREGDAVTRMRWPELRARFGCSVPVTNSESRVGVDLSDSLNRLTIRLLLGQKPGGSRWDCEPLIISSALELPPTA